MACRKCVSSPFEVKQVTATQAMAAVFIRYLDAKGKLSTTYFAARDRHISSDLSTYESYREILEKQMGMSIVEEVSNLWTQL